MSASFEEKSVWIQFLGMVAALGGYFIVAGVMMSNGVWNIVPYVPVFAVSVVFLVVLQVVFHTAAAIVRRPEPRDERDKLIAWRAESNSGWVLASGVLGAVCCLIVSVNSVWIAHLLLASLFLSEVVKYLFQILYYRRGMQL